MGTDTIGSVIAKLRKELGCTQEELAKAVGVSAQAVSKWENGGVPDTELLPSIADYFKISVDALFGRSITDYGDVQYALMKKIAEAEAAGRYKKAFEVCWNIERALCGALPSNKTVDDYIGDTEEGIEHYSSILTDDGFTRMGLGNRIQYFLLVPDAEDKDAALLNGIDYCALFKDLSDESFFKALVFLNKRRADKAFTANLLVKNLGLEQSAATEVIKAIAKYRMIKTTTIEMDDETQEVYTFAPAPAFVALLIFARELIDRPNSFCWHTEGRSKPYLE